MNGQRTEDLHYFIGSQMMTARNYGAALRGHGRIRNNLHRQLDPTLGKDASRVQRPHGAENLAMVRRVALGLLKPHSARKSIACKRKTTALNPTFLEEILQGGRNLVNP